MKLQQLRYLVAIVDHGTMTAAAEQLHVAQPALSRAIRDLEHELGAELFTRVGRRMVLNGLGREVDERARHVLAEVAVIRELAHRSRQVLAVAATPTTEELLSVLLLGRLAANFPEVRLSMITADGPDDVVRAVREGRAQLGFVDCDPPAGLGYRPVLEDEVVLLCPPGTDDGPVRWADLGAFRHVLPSAGSARRAELDHLFAQLGIVPDVGAETNDRASWKAMVLAGLGVSLRYRMQVDDAVSRGAVIRPLRPPATRTIGVVYRPDSSSAGPLGLLEDLRDPAAGPAIARR